MAVYTLKQRAWDRLIEDADFGKKIIFSDEAHFDLGGYVNKLNCRIAVRIHWKASVPKTNTVWCGFWCRGVIGPFFFENEQGEAVTFKGDHFCSQKLKRGILATFGFNTTAVRATQSKLHSMFCGLFLKIALSAAELMSIATSKLRFDIVGLLFMGCHQR